MSYHLGTSENVNNTYVELFTHLYSRKIPRCLNSLNHQVQTCLSLFPAMTTSGIQLTCFQLIVLTSANYRRW